jgi:hypothetical protein
MIELLLKQTIKFNSKLGIQAKHLNNFKQIRSISVLNNVTNSIKYQKIVIFSFKTDLFDRIIL